jgi:hypothetical protein
MSQVRRCEGFARSNRGTASHPSSSSGSSGAEKLEDIEAVGWAWVYVEERIEEMIRASTERM